MIEQFGFTSLREVIAALFLLSGLVFFVGSAIGMLRLPDFYSRIHASGNSETLGCTLSFIGLMIYEGPTLTAAKMAFVFLLVFMANRFLVLLLAEWIDLRNDIEFQILILSDSLPVDVKIDTLVAICERFETNLNRLLQFDLFLWSCHACLYFILVIYSRKKGK